MRPRPDPGRTRPPTARSEPTSRAVPLLWRAVHHRPAGEASTAAPSPVVIRFAGQAGTNVSEQLVSRMKDFAAYAATCKDEKGEAQVFLDRLFRAMGHAGYKEAGAKLETRVKRASGQTNYADLAWPDREVMFEMKKRGEPLAKHFPQLRGYWLDTKGWRARYLVLCNFEEFWVYDTKINSDSPSDQIKADDLPSRWMALAFLHVDPLRPLFGYDRTAISAKVAEPVAELYQTLVARGEDADKTQRFLLQCVLALFAEDFGLLTGKEFTQALVDCGNGQSTFDLLGALFQQMNTSTRAKAGRWKDVPYFNGGLFSTVDPVDLKPSELRKLLDVAGYDWAKIDPSIFGTIFQQSMLEDERHSRGAHYTTEADILKVVVPTIVRPWRERIERTDGLAGLLSLREEMLKYRVLDPACGSGNFLYVAYRELRRLEMQVLLRIRDEFPTNKAAQYGCAVSVKQFLGFDILPNAVEVAKVTLMLAKELSIREMEEVFDSRQVTHFGLVDPSLPLDNLSETIQRADSLFVTWPEVDAIVGNPPFQSKNKMQGEWGAAAVKRLHAAFPGVPGRADYCVYFLRKAHDHLLPGKRAGLVGTNTIRQNYSREGGLDYIMANGGTITEAVGTQDWSGDAAVHVSIVNWVKGVIQGPFALSWQDEAGLWHEATLSTLPSSLTANTDVTAAKELAANGERKTCFQGQTHGHEGFLVAAGDAAALLADSSSRAVIHPYLTGDELLSSVDGRPLRWVIDLSHCGDLFAVSAHAAAHRHVVKAVMPDIIQKAKDERTSLGGRAGPRQAHAERWWRLWRARDELFGELAGLSRYVACSRVTKRPIFSFIDARIRPNDALSVFTFEDDYSFGVLQSAAHWAWFMARCSTLKGDFRYTSNTVYDTFPWPQAPSLKAVRAVADAAAELRKTRARIQQAHKLSLRDLYRVAERPGRNDVKDAQAALDRAVDAAYGRPAKSDLLAYLFDLNAQCAAAEAAGTTVAAPGLPPWVSDRCTFVTDDCVRMPMDVAPVL